MSLLPGGALKTLGDLRMESGIWREPASLAVTTSSPPTDRIFLVPFILL